MHPLFAVRDYFFIETACYRSAQLLASLQTKVQIENIMFGKEIYMKNGALVIFFRKRTAMNIYFPKFMFKTLNSWYFKMITHFSLWKPIFLLNLCQIWLRHDINIDRIDSPYIKNYSIKIWQISISNVIHEENCIFKDAEFLFLCS